MEVGDEFEILAPTSLCTEQWLKRMKVDVENTPEVIFRIHKSSCDRRTHKLYSRAKPKTRKYPRHEEHCRCFCFCVSFCFYVVRVKEDNK